MRRFEFVDGKSSKFWEIALAGASFDVRWGRIGTAGQSQTKTFPTDAKALAEHDKLVAEKVRKGYAEVDGAPSEGAPAKPAPTPRAPRAPVEPEAIAPLEPGDGWMPCAGYALQIRDGRIVARNDKGKELASLPKAVKEHELGEALADAVAFLDAHDAECRESVEAWMLRSLTVPRGVLASVWIDPAWRAPLENLVIEADGVTGLLRAVEARGLGVVDLDGETRWIDAARVAIPHPILVDELDDWRELLTELGVAQRTAQLFRETFVRPTPGSKEAEGFAVDAFAGGEFPMLAMVSNEARKQGYRVSGGCAVCRVWSANGLVEARYELGDGDPTYETSTGSLRWVDARQRGLPIAEVGPVAYSEGMRMAAGLYAKRVIKTEKEDDDV